MPVIINFKICDNAKECGGIEVCPTKAIYWNEDEKKIKIDNSKCISCCKCEKACPVEAIKVAKDEKEFERIKKEIKEDSRRISDLFVDRYGAMPIDPDTLIEKEELDKIIGQSVRPVFVEFFNDDSIECLKNSNTIGKLIPQKDIDYRKINVDDSLMNKYGVKVLPSLLLFNKEELVGKIEDFFNAEQFEELKEKMNALLGKC